MNRAYCVEGLGPLTLVAEGNREHRVDSVVEPRQRRDRTASERAVVRNAGSDERMRQLQQDGACPADQDKAFCVDSARGVGGQRVVSQVPSESADCDRTHVWRQQISRRCCECPGSAKCAAEYPHRRVKWCFLSR